MEYKMYRGNTYNIHTIKTDKFKTVRMEIIFSMEVSKEKMPVYTFLSDIMSDSSKKYKTRKDIAIRLEELYKTNFYGNTNKVGNMFITSFILEFIDPIYINDENYFEEVLKFPFEVINNPNANNKEFDITNFNIVKKRMREEIESIKESSDRLSLINALNAMDDSSPTSYRVLGTTSDLDNITPSNLYNAYEDLFNHANCDIFIIGNINMDEAIKIIKDNFVNRVIKLNKPKIDVINNTKKRVLRKNDNSNFVQSTLVMIYNICNLDKKTKDITFHLFNYILGSGGLNSKLYDNLRNKNSLCYGVRSIYLKYDGLLIILVSLDKSNVEKAELLIKKSVNEMIKGKILEDDIKDAKKSILFSLKMSYDNNVSILNNYVFNYYDELPLIEDRIKEINKLNKNDLIECGKKLKLNTIYVLNAKGDNV